MSLISTDLADETFSSAKTSSDVDDALELMTSEGGAADFIAIDDWRPVLIGGRLEILVPADVYSIGGFRVGRSTEYGAQSVADTFDSILPSRKLLREIQRAADPRIPFIDIKAPPYSVPLSQISTHHAVQVANDAANDKFAAAGIAQGDGLAIGYRKAFVSGPGLDGTTIAIYGGIGTGLDPASGQHEIVQPYYTNHAWNYGDYSQAIVLVSNKAKLDGSSVNLRRDVFGSSDPSVVALVSDYRDGMGKIVRYDPVYPNAGAKSRALFGAIGTVASPSPSGSGSTSSSSSKNSPTPSARASTTSSTTKTVAKVAVGIAGAALIGWVLIY